MITVTLEMPDEYEEVITDMGFDVDGYFQTVLNDLGKRYEVKVENHVLAMNQNLIDDEVDDKKDKAKVKK